MLQQILQDMYIDPDVLDALNEDQKKTLFLKMRQEQVRRWTEREEKEGADAEHRKTKPKKANSKTVSWLLGRDGDVAVAVIGEADELASKFICSGLGETKAPKLLNNTKNQTTLKSQKATESAETEKEPTPNSQKGISLHLKGNTQKAAETKLFSPSQIPPCEEQEMVKVVYHSRKRELNNNKQDHELKGYFGSLCCACNTSNALKVPGPTSACGRVPPLCGVKKHSTLASTRINVRAEVSWKAASQDVGPPGGAPTCAGRGRVAQLMKTFSAESTSAPAPSRGVKPALPSKPSHLRITTTPTVR
uniref:Zgc:100829 n=1 Tax=Tetraodon nigroviridis TaxID=99883 RepID=H3C459_TETNG